MVLSLDQLPQEILHTILCYCDPCTSVSLERTARCFGGVTNEHILWRIYCGVYFQHWDNAHNMHQKLALPVHEVNWKTLYISRHHIDRVTDRLLNEILDSQSGRLEKFRTIIELGYDVKDTLLRNMSVDSTAVDYLARRYYSEALLTCLHRNIAIKEWAKIKNGEAVSLDRALGAFDLFVPGRGCGNLDDISNTLDKIVTSLLASNPGIDKLTCRGQAKTIAGFMRANNFTGIKHGREYHMLQHSFLGLALMDPEHNSLPLISAAIYCYVAQKLGLNAWPCGFPFHVHVIVRPPRGFDADGNVLGAESEGDPIYMDPFRSDAEIAVATMRNQLDLLGVSVNGPTPFLNESTTSEIVIRCSMNILNSIQRSDHIGDAYLGAVDVIGAKYAGLWSAMLLSDSSRRGELRHQLPWLMELFATEFPSDIYLVEDYIAPLFQGTLEYAYILESLHVMLAADEIPKQVKYRTPGQTQIRYHIGQVFRHRRYNYMAIITGWDTECGANEQWMRRMGIDRLRDGRHQGFYNVLVEDRSVRYVAEENIEPIAPNFSELPASILSSAGRHFKRWDDMNHVFVSNIRDEYPDD